ncbi:cryptochrome/photolyase family protein [Novosphingobium sp. KACC 22771]|uniref:cryptochrome/photolyase family protein n=1 Tax=Novosphingobium sp. KACC 22771 TaxID=3025670 RepID=UPI0023659706|nr:deoxyribodipyrimidine photo-lyase [Novosphingobium sp. KACC 22771]WDF71064.1 deoxyribodipyrimidine photo-lyase [Novosphingobium sp. KACC 22771]
MTEPILLWFRRDLRLSDQAAVMAAAQSGAPVIPVYVLDDDTPKHRKLGAASRWWLHGSLESLARDLEAKGSCLILRRGAAAEVLSQLAQETGAREIHGLHHYEPWWLNAEKAIRRKGLDLHLHDGNFLIPPGSVTTGAGTPYRIYTPFWRQVQMHMPPAQPAPAPDTIPAPKVWPTSDDLADWSLLPTKPDWAPGFRAEWTPGEGGAQDRLDAFLPRAPAYEERRNLPSQSGTSRLSPHLAFGEISPATLWHAAMDRGGSVNVFLSELGWRDYAQNIIAEFPDYGAHSAKPDFEGMAWRDAPDELKAWQAGMTGYPIVDAGMRELWAWGWMHNRVRMIVASFLIKHLLIDWRHGEQWFWDTLVDADYGQNAVNWQWSAGSGVDANQFTRIMAPLTQSPKFEAGDYIRRWVPELADLDEGEIHDPTPITRRRCGYPMPIVGHVEGRERALAAYRAMKG